MTTQTKRDVFLFPTILIIIWALNAIFLGLIHGSADPFQVGAAAAIFWTYGRRQGRVDHTDTVRAMFRRARIGEPDGR